MKRLVNEKHKRAPWWRSAAIALAVFALVAVIFSIGLRNTALGSEDRELALVERAINRAVVSCYAIEGFYPPSIDYLIENYGLDIDLDKYYVQHEAVASNIYPDIWVVRRGVNDRA